MVRRISLLEAGILPRAISRKLLTCPIAVAYKLLKNQFARGFPRLPLLFAE